MCRSMGKSVFVLLLCVMTSVVQTAIASLRGAQQTKTWQARTQQGNRSEALTIIQQKTRRQLEDAGDDEDDFWATKAEHMSAGVDVFSSVCATIDDPSWQTAGEAVSSLGALAAVTVPPPAGLLAGGAMGLVSGLMGIFSGGGPSNGDILDSIEKNFDKVFQVMNAGFKKVVSAVGTVATKVDDLAEQVVLVQSKLDQLLKLTEDLYSSTVLQGKRVKEFTQRVAALNRRLAYAESDPSVMPAYISYLHNLAEEYADMEGGVGALSGENLDAMISVSWTSTVQDYTLVTHALILYNWFYQARVSLFSVLMQSSIFKFGKLTSMARGYTERFVQDINDYNEVLKKWALDGVISFQASQLASCEATASSIMSFQGLSLSDFMSPYVHLTNGQCSLPYGFDWSVSPWSSPPAAFDSGDWPGREYYNEDATLGMLADVTESECTAANFWNGRSSITNLQNNDVYVADGITPSSPAAAHDVQVEWLGSCPSGVSLGAGQCKEITVRFGFKITGAARGRSEIAIMTLDDKYRALLLSFHRSAGSFDLWIFCNENGGSPVNNAGCNVGRFRHSPGTPRLWLPELGIFHQVTFTARWSGRHTLKLQSPGHEPWSTEFDWAEFWPEASATLVVRRALLGTSWVMSSFHAEQVELKKLSRSEQLSSSMVVGQETVPRTELPFFVDGLFIFKLYEAPMCSPVCGCRISANSNTTSVRSLPMCRNACYASSTYYDKPVRPAFRYYRFTPLKVRGNPTNPSALPVVQISEINFRTGGVVINRTGVVATSPGGVASTVNPTSEGPEKAIDGRYGTKWYDRSGLKSSLTLVFPRQIRIDEFRFATANDAPHRDPISWNFEGSNDAVAWTMLQSESDYATSTERFFSSGWFVLDHDLTV